MFVITLLILAYDILFQERIKVLHDKNQQPSSSLTVSYSEGAAAAATVAAGAPLNSSEPLAPIANLESV
jgi:hypothetical protein